MAERRKIVLFDSNISYAGFPFALVSLTSFLDTCRYDIRIITKRASPNWEKEILEACDGALCLGVTSIIGKPVTHAIRMSRAVKAAYPELPVVWGGWLPITLPDLCLAERSVDFICTGPGERTFKEFVDMLESGDWSRRHTIEGLGFHENGIPVYTSRRQLEDINAVPDFDLGLVDWDRYVQASSLGRSGLALHTSIGCPWRCGFCCEKHYCGRRWYGLTPERVIAFMKSMRKVMDYDHVLYHDTNFFVDERRVARLCRLLIDEGLAMPSAGANGRCNELARYKPETWALMRDSGMKSVFLGVESANNDTLRLMDKDITVDQTIRVLSRCAEYGIRPTLSMAMGWDAERYTREGPDRAFSDEFREAVRFLRRVRREILPDFNAYMYLYNPLPCTTMFDVAVRHGYRPPATLAEWGHFDTHEPNAPWLRFSAMNRMRLFGLRNVLHKLGRDYDAYVRQLPLPLRWMAALMVKSIMPFARMRMATGVMAFPIEFFLFEKTELLFRLLNDRVRIIALHGRE